MDVADNPSHLAIDRSGPRRRTCDREVTGPPRHLLGTGRPRSPFPNRGRDEQVTAGRGNRAMAETYRLVVGGERKCYVSESEMDPWETQWPVSRLELKALGGGGGVGTCRKEVNASEIRALGTARCVRNPAKSLISLTPKPLNFEWVGTLIGFKSAD